MSTSTRNLWPEDIAVTDDVAPVTILKEQASLLGQRTQNIVEAYVIKPKYATHRDPPFRYNFYLMAPALDYRYQLFTITHGLEFYPVSITFEDLTVEIADEDGLMQELANIFSSEKTKRIISSLIAQSKE
jgi:hypothetical protein